MWLRSGRGWMLKIPSLILWRDVKVSLVTWTSLNSCQSNVRANDPVLWKTWATTVTTGRPNKKGGKPAVAIEEEEETCGWICQKNKCKSQVHPHRYPPPDFQFFLPQSLLLYPFCLRRASSPIPRSSPHPLFVQVSFYFVFHPCCWYFPIFLQFPLFCCILIHSVFKLRVACVD